MERRAIGVEAVTITLTLLPSPHPNSLPPNFSSMPRRDPRQRKKPHLRIQWRQVNLNRKLRTISIAPIDRKLSRHTAGRQIAEIKTPQRRMHRPNRFGGQQLDRMPQQLLTRQHNRRQFDDLLAGPPQFSEGGRQPRGGDFVAESGLE